VALAFRWRRDEAFAALPQSGLAWLCFLFPLVKPDMQISRIRLSPIPQAFALGRSLRRDGTA
jgi:hypothetical protein